ncbi:MAG TPA: STAS domain-containing protein [Ornithinibacter sp.]|nr:STAS domain-containing protein [Ornithinibacter sp.]
MGSAATTLSSRTISSGTLRARHLDGQQWVLELSGEADVTTMDMLRRELAQVAIVDRADSVVDVTKLSFCDVASAHLILTARRTIPVTVTGATGSVQRVFDLVDALKAHGLHRARSPIQPTGAIGVSVWW